MISPIDVQSWFNHLSQGSANTPLHLYLEWRFIKRLDFDLYVKPSISALVTANSFKNIIQT